MNPPPKVSEQRLTQMLRERDSAMADAVRDHRRISADFADSTAAIRELSALREVVREAGPLLNELADTITVATAGSTHYEGCEVNHKNCAWLKRLDALRAKMGAT